MYDTIMDAYNKGILTQTECENIIVLCKDVISEMSKNTDVHERLVNTMGNEILLTAEERGIEKGSFTMALENIKNAMEAFDLSFDDICDKLRIQDKEKYRSYIVK